MLVGNAAHDIRNTLTQKIRPDYPELTAIDNAAAVVNLFYFLKIKLF